MRERSQNRKAFRDERPSDNGSFVLKRVSAVAFAFFKIMASHLSSAALQLTPNCPRGGGAGGDDLPNWMPLTERN